LASKKELQPAHHARMRQRVVLFSQVFRGGGIENNPTCPEALS
jgi:hypothetical protein